MLVREAGGEYGGGGGLEGFVDPEGFGVGGGTNVEGYDFGGVDVSAKWRRAVSLDALCLSHGERWSKRNE